MKKPATHNRKRQEEWREKVPELSHLIQSVAEPMWDEAIAGSAEHIPDEWVSLVEELQYEVNAPPEDWQRDWTKEHLRSYRWHFATEHLGRLLENVMHRMRIDLGCKEGVQTFPQMVLVKRAMELLSDLLHHYGDDEPSENIDEHHWRVFHALRPLTPRLDDEHLRRLRALQAVTAWAKQMRLLDEDEIEASVERLRKIRDEEGSRFPFTEEEAEQHRHYMRVTAPVSDGLLAKQSLAEIDDRFADIDPLVLVEELGEAKRATGGKAEGGEGRTGPVRALARLAVMCSALGFSQREGESFDEAVERARSNLLVTRSRIRKSVREFPGQVSEEILES